MSRLFWKWGKSIFEKIKIMINIYKNIYLIMINIYKNIYLIMINIYKNIYLLLSSFFQKMDLPHFENKRLK